MKSSRSKFLVNEKMDAEVKKFYFREMLRFKSITTTEGFRSSAGIPSPIFPDVRRLISSPDLLKKIGMELGKVVEKLDADVIAAASLSGDAWTVATSLETKIPCVILRKEPHFHGEETIILGAKPRKNDRIVLIEDGVGTAGQIKNFITNLKKEGFEIKEVVAIFDAFEGDGEKTKLEFLEKEGVKLHYLFRFREYFDFILKEGLISSQYHEIVIDWLSNPFLWSDGSDKWQWYNNQKELGNIWLKYK